MARSLYNNIRVPSAFQRATFYLFKEHIEPKWEDARNTNGGSWTANLPKGANAKTLLDTWWLHVVRARVGWVKVDLTLEMDIQYQRRQLGRESSADGTEAPL